MKNWLPFILLFINIFSVKSQVKDSSIISVTPTKLISGIIVGSSNIAQKALINSHNFSSNNPTFNLGLLFEREFNNQFKFSFRPGFLIGSDIKTTFKNANKEYSYSYSSAIIEMPLLFVYTFRANKIANGVPNYFYFGPVYNYNLSNSNVRLTGTEKRYVASFIKNYETALKFGFGYDFKLKYVNFRPEFGYTNGFNVLKSNAIPNFEFSSIVNNQFSINILFSHRNNKVIYRKSTKPRIPLWKKLLFI
jgi:hypothetical protein